MPMDFQIEPTIVVNDFVFCLRHGDELCHKCTYDHRFTNNYVLQDKLPEDFNEDGNYDFEYRDPFNVYALGAVHVPGRGEDESYKCSEHDKINCGTCFDWLGFVKKQAKEAEDQADWLKKRKKYLDKRDK